MTKTEWMPGPHRSILGFCLIAALIVWGASFAGIAHAEDKGEALGKITTNSLMMDVPSKQDLPIGTVWDFAAQATPEAGKAGASGGGGGLGNADELARKSNNPLGGDFIMWINQWYIDFAQGDITDRTRINYTHIFQPMIPIALPSLGPDWVWVNRPTLTLLYSSQLPSLNQSRLENLSSHGAGGGVGASKSVARDAPIDFNSESGVGDLVYFTLVGRSISTKSEFFNDEGNFVVAGGITTQLPIGSDEFSNDTYGFGPAGVISWIGKKYILGALVQHWVDVGHTGNSSGDVNQTSFQYFYRKTFKGGWTVGAAPTILVNWEADSDNRWSVPIGMGVTKVVKVGKLPVSIGVEVQYFVARQDTYGTEWRIQFTMTPITPNFIGNLFKKAGIFQKK